MSKINSCIILPVAKMLRKLLTVAVNLNCNIFFVIASAMK